MFLSLIRTTKSVPCLSIAALTFSACLGFTLSANAQTKKPTTPAPAAKPAAPAAKPATPAAHSTGGTTTAAHTTTGSHTTTTTSHTTTTAGGHTVTSTSTTRTTTVSHTGGPVGRTPVGSHEVRTANGSVVRTRANGSRADIHDARRGMDIHHGLDGNRRISVERADHSRVYAERGGRGYVQHPYMYHGREYGHRTYYDHGRYYDRYYNRYAYRGVYMDVYAPVRYYPVGFYGWAYNPWAIPIAYSWGWGAAPWYGYYGAYFAPYPVYPSAAFWLTDYLIATSLQAAYTAQVAANAQAQADAVAAANAQAIVTPDIKQMVADEVKRQIALENAEAAANAQSQQLDPASSSIARMLGDNQPHVFIAGSDLDVVDAAGVECPISQGDIVEVASAPPADAEGATAIVLASKGGKECAKSDHITIAFNDLQDMQNHMRETIDTGMGDLQSKQGKGGLPPAPPSAQTAPVQAAFTVGAPPPDQTASTEIAAQTQAADQAEQEVASATPVSGPSDTAISAPIPPPAAPAPAPTTIALGQTVDQVTASMGQPTRIIDLGTKKIYVYKDMKITFKAGKVSDVE
ncbi:MAG: hypothetical protein ABSA39_14500 [Edaphobacter sp.]